MNMQQPRILLHKKTGNGNMKWFVFLYYKTRLRVDEDGICHFSRRMTRINVNGETLVRIHDHDF